jgi:apolipoprotein N-acyltransferase
LLYAEEKSHQSFCVTLITSSLFKVLSRRVPGNKITLPGSTATVIFGYISQATALTAPIKNAGIPIASAAIPTVSNSPPSKSADKTAGKNTATATAPAIINTL